MKKDTEFAKVWLVKKEAPINHPIKREKKSHEGTCFQIKPKRQENEKELIPSICLRGGGELSLQILILSVSDQRRVR